MATRALDKVTISFGLVSIPTKVYSSNEPGRQIHFHLLHAKDHARLEQQYVCKKEGEVVPRDEMIKGYEIKKGRYVELTDEELDALHAEASNTIEIQEFVPIGAVDPIYVDRTYYLGPDKGGERAYALLARAMREAELGGIAQYAARGKAYVVLVRAYRNGLLMHQLRYPDEIKDWDEVPVGKLPRVKESELSLAGKVIDQIAEEEFHPEKYRDVVRDRIREAIKKKAAGEEITAPEPPREAEVVDLMEALKASLGGPKRARPRNSRRKRNSRSRAA